MNPIVKEGTRAVIYSRVSTREQAEQGYSIESQLKLLHEFAKENRIDIVKEFIDVESAKSAGRTQYTEMQKFLRQNTTVKTILCEKTDRLYRNFYDYVALDIDQSGLTIVLVKENAVLNRESRSHEKLVHGLKVLLAKNYIDNLKEETSKGMLEKAEQGEFPHRAPLGYKNNLETHTIELDPLQAPLVRRMFELYATGTYSIDTLREKMADEGLRSRGGRKVHRSEIAAILVNPMYHGTFRWRKRLFKGIHEPLISKDLFDHVQRVLKRFVKPRRTKLDFPFRGLLTCGKCGTSFTAERKKKRYVYYHCSFSKNRCDNVFIREEDVAKRLEEIVKGIQIDQEILDFVTEGLKQSHAEEKDYHDQAIASLQHTYKKLQEKLDKAYEDKLEGVITADYWERQSEMWRREQEEARASIAKHESANQSYFDLGIELLALARDAYDLFKVRSLPEKRQLLNLVASNLVVDGEKIWPSYRKPFDMLVKSGDCLNWRPQRDSNP